MKRLSFFFMTIAALVMTAIGCKPEELTPDVPSDGAKVVGTFKQAEVVAAAAGLYEAWLEDSDNVPSAMTVGSTELTQPQYIYAIAKTLVDIQAKSTADVQVLSYKMADHPERDSYDQLEIAVFNGPKNDTETEDLANVATRMMAAMASKGQVPNQTNFKRGETNIAFSTNRATITILRALAEYKPQGKMPEKVSTDYLSTSATIKGFATEFVKYLDVWENSVTEVLSADGSRNSGNGKPWENAHFIPIPYTGSLVNADGTEQFDPKFRPYYEPEVAGVKYTAAQCWGIALKALIDLCSLEGSTVWATERTPDTPAHTLGNGKTMNAPIPMLEEWFVWNQHPWYENENDGGVVKYNEVPVTEVDIAFMMRVMPWHLTRSSQLGAIGNYQQFGTSKESTLVYDGYLGLICPMREFLIAARIFKYILDNDITENVYDAIKDQKFSYDLYGSEKPDISLDVDKMNFTYEGGEQKVKVTTKDKAWTATVEGEGFTVSPMEGPAGVETEVTITAAANTLGSRSATVTFTTAETAKSKTVKITQGASPTSATIREFATEYVKIIDVWMKNVSPTAIVGVENAHYVPEDTKVVLGEIEYNLADAVEIASRSYLLLRGYDGNNTTTYGRNLPMPKLEKAYTMDNTLPETHSYTWGENPYAESTNGGWFRMTTTDGEAELVKIDLLDDYSQRHTNYPLANGGALSNFCAYTGNYLAGYTGCCCVKRIMLAYAYFFKYMLDNNLQDATGISPDQTFEAPLFGENMAAPTIKAFAQEYVKLINVWETTTGTVNYMCPTGVVTPDFKYDGVPNIEGGHYIPLDTKVTIAGTEYTTGEVLDIALRSYLLLRGYDATDETKVGAGSFAQLQAPYKMSDNFLPARPITWGSAPFNETGSCTANADGSVSASGNGGELKMGTPPDGQSLVKIDLLDNFAQRNANFPPVKNSNAIGNMAGYNNRADCPGYYGSASGARMLLTYAYFFKYMLDNNLEDATGIAADVTFETYLFNKNTSSPSQPEQPAAKEIATAQDFVDFLKAVKAGESVEKWTNDNGEVTLAADIDLAGVNYDWTTHAVAVANANNGCTIDVPAFTGVFDGKNHKITGFKPTVELAAGTTFGLFPAIKGATIKNVTLTGEMKVSAKETADAGMFVGTALNSTIKNVTVNGKLVSTGGQVDNKRFSLAAICGFAYVSESNATLVENCVSNVEVAAESDKNTKNGATSCMYGGIVAFATSNSGAEGRVTIKNCVNNGDMNVTLGRCSGICPTANCSTIVEKCTNNGNQVNAFLDGRLANIVCNLAANSSVIDCVNNGNVEATNPDYKGTIAGLVALMGNDTCSLEGGANYGTIKAPATVQEAHGLLVAYFNKFKYVKDVVASGRMFIDGKEVEITESNYMENIGRINSANAEKITNITWVAPTK